MRYVIAYRPSTSCPMLSIASAALAAVRLTSSRGGHPSCLPRKAGTVPRHTKRAKGDGMEGFTGIGHIAIRARDLDPMLDFYTKTLGFAEMFRLNQDNGDLMLVYVRVTDMQYLEFFPNGTGDGPAPREAVGLNHICLTVDDLDHMAAQLKERRSE